MTKKKCNLICKYIPSLYYYVHNDDSKLTPTCTRPSVSIETVQHLHLLVLRRVPLEYRAVPKRTGAGATENSCRPRGGPSHPVSSKKRQSHGNSYTGCPTRWKGPPRPYGKGPLLSTNSPHAQSANGDVNGQVRPKAGLRGHFVLISLAQMSRALLRRSRLPVAASLLNGRRFFWRPSATRRFLSWWARCMSAFNGFHVLLAER